jgi:hypothetical protein
MGMFGSKGKARSPEQQAEITRLMSLINQNPKQEETNMKKNTEVVTPEVAAVEVAAAKSTVAVEVKEATPAPVVEVTVVKAPVVVTKAPTKSDMIRALFTEGATVAEIAKATNSHYSFVYGVCRALKGSSPSEDKGPSRSDEIRAMADAGNTPGEIARALNANYSFVHSVVKKHREEQGQ